MRRGEALSVLFEDPLDKELLLSNREPLAVLVCGTSIRYSIKTRAERGFGDVVCAFSRSDRIDLSCTNSRESQLNLSLALSHGDVVVVEQVELEVVVLTKRVRRGMRS